jgi:hypothetical protein
MKSKIFKIWMLMCFTLSIFGNGIVLAATATTTTTKTTTKTTATKTTTAKTTSAAPKTTTAPVATAPVTTPAPVATTPVTTPAPTTETTVAPVTESASLSNTGSEATSSRRSRRKSKEEKPKLSKEEQDKAKAEKAAAKAKAKEEKAAAKAKAKAEKEAAKLAKKQAKEQSVTGTTPDMALATAGSMPTGVNGSQTTVEPAPISAEGAMIANPADAKVRRVKKVVTSKKEEKIVKVKGFKKVNVYTDSGDETNNFTPTGWMGDYGDLKLSTKCFISPKKGSTCIKIFYSAKKSQGAGWAGIYWQEPANNWGDIDKGLNLAGAKKLTFYARGDRGGEIIEVFKVGGIKGTYADTTDVSFGPIMLTKKWKKYTIKLKNKDLSRISGGFGWVTSAETNPDGMVFYLDEIQYQ